MKVQAHTTAEADDTFRLFTELLQAMKGKMVQHAILPFSQLEALHCVAHAERIPMREIAEKLHIKAPSATFLVNELVAQGLLERKENDTDRRRVEIVVSKKGASVLKKCIALRARTVSEMLSPLPREDRAHFTKILSKILNAHRA